MAKNKIGIFADKTVGQKSLEFLLENFPEDINIIVCVDKDSSVYSGIIAPRNLSSKVFFNDDLKKPEVAAYIKSLNLDYIILAWWPFIIETSVIEMAVKGVLNFHPSYLPYNRGKHYNFWSIVEETPFGVTIHFVDNSIDGGDVIFQKIITTTWADTGETLHTKAEEAMLQLFKESYPKIKSDSYVRMKQNLSKGSFHLAKEIDQASCIDLEKKYTGKELLNILRARTFPPHPGAWFEYEGEKYEARISINKSHNNK